MRPRCPAPPHVVPAVHHICPPSAGRACAGLVPRWLQVACASWFTRVACAPAWCPGCCTLHCDPAVILGSPHPSFVGGTFPCLAHHSFPQCASGAAAVANWVLEPPPPPPHTKLFPIVLVTAASCSLSYHFPNVANRVCKCLPHSPVDSSALKCRPRPPSSPLLSTGCWRGRWPQPYQERTGPAGLVPFLGSGSPSGMGAAASQCVTPRGVRQFGGL